MLPGHFFVAVQGFGSSFDSSGPIADAPAAGIGPLRGLVLEIFQNSAERLGMQATNE
jgi:hypothetical protein